MKLSYKILTFDGNNYWGENGGFLKTPNDNHFERDLNSFNFKNIQFKANDNELGVINFPSNVLINKYNLNSLIMTVTNIFKTTIFQLNNLKLDIDTHIKEIFNEKLLVFSKDYFNLLDHEYYDLKLNKCKIDLDYFRKLNSLSQKNCYLSIREDDFLNTLPTLKLMVNDVMYNCKEEVLNDYVKEGKIIEKFGTRESFAKASGITAKSIYDKLNNKTIWKQPEISKAMDLLSISGEDIELYFFKQKAHDTEQE